jgi:cobyrinic acid a,c-diamide synthase
VANGLPVYAECGGLMFLARELVHGSSTYPMAGVLDLVIEQCDRPQGHGYEVAVVDRDNEFFATGSELRGHEFHYSRVHSGEDLEKTVLAVSRGQGTGNGRDGVAKRRVWASYLHLHSVGAPGWCDGFLALAGLFAGERLRVGINGASVAWG